MTTELRGPYRPYISIYFPYSPLDAWDWAVAAGAGAVATAALKIGAVPKFNELISETFVISEHPPLGVRLSPGLARFLCILTLLQVYLALRCARVRRLVSLLGTFMFANLPQQKIWLESPSSTPPDPLLWFFFTAIVWQWLLWRSRPDLESWRAQIQLMVLSLTIGAAMSTKFIGFATWLWVIICNLWQIWTRAGDLTISMKKWLQYLFYSQVILIFIPLFVFVGSYHYQFNHWSSNDSDYLPFVSPLLKHKIRYPGEQHWQLENLLYGSNITLRHVNSLAGYLHSELGRNYLSGSQEQVITLNCDEYNIDNTWVVEPQYPHMMPLVWGTPVHNNEKIKLRHLSTGKLMRASSAKPPISEEEYDHEVSCTGDSDYEGDADETWTIRAADDEMVVVPKITEFTLENIGHDCRLLSHDLRLAGWANYDQEVLCVTSPNLVKARFIVENAEFQPSMPVGEDPEAFQKRIDELHIRKMLYPKVPNNNYERFKEFITIMLDYVKRQYKYNWYERNFSRTDMIEKDRSSSFVTPEYWIFQWNESSTISNILWASSTVSIFIFIGYQVKQILFEGEIIGLSTKAYTSNPFSFIYDTVGLECVLGWWLHYYVFYYSPHQNLRLELYIPSMIFAVILLFRTLTRSV